MPRQPCSIGHRPPNCRYQRGTATARHPDEFPRNQCFDHTAFMPKTLLLLTSPLIALKNRPHLTAVHGSRRDPCPDKFDVVRQYDFLRRRAQLSLLQWFPYRSKEISDMRLESHRPDARPSRGLLIDLIRELAPGGTVTAKDPSGST